MYNIINFYDQLINMNVLFINIRLDEWGIVLLL